MLGLALMLVGAIAVYARVADEQFDFAIDYASAKAILDGDNPYDDAGRLIRRYVPEVPVNDQVAWPNWKPPFRFLIGLPFVAFPFDAAATIWIAVNAVALVTAGGLVAIRLRRPWRFGVAAGAGVLSLPVVQADLSLGQMNGILLLLLTLVWVRLRNGPKLSGVCLGVAIAARVFPAFLLLPLTRRNRPTVGYAILSAAAATAVGLVVIGPRGIFDFVETAWSGYGPYDSADFNVSALARIGLVAGIIVAVALTLLATRPPRRLTGDPFWAAVPLMLLAFPIVWEHYLVLALPWVALAILRNRSIWPVVLGILISVPAIGFGHAWIMTLGLTLAVIAEAVAPRRVIALDEPAEDSNVEHPERHLRRSPRLWKQAAGVAAGPDSSAQCG